MASFEFETVSIPLALIREGINHFDFDVSFTEPPRETSWAFSKDIKLDVEVQTVDDDYLVRVTVQGEVHLVCDRCAETFQRQIHEDVRTLLTSRPLEDADGDGGDVRAIESSSNVLDISQEVIDGLRLAIPGKIVCKPECQGLCPHCGTNLNESTCQCQEDPIDPRWEALKKLKLDDH